MHTNTLRSPARRGKRLLRWALVPLLWLSMTAANAALFCTASLPAS